jgi:hypothetical protein
VDATTVTNLGGWCQLAGVVLVVWDLLALTRYRVDLASAAAKVRRWWTARVADARRLFGWRGRSVTVRGGAAAVFGFAGHARGHAFPGPFSARPGQSLEDQVAALAEFVNRLLDEVMKEQEERAKAISDERQARRDELQAETERLERLIAEARHEFKNSEKSPRVGYGYGGRACPSCWSASCSRPGRRTWPAGWAGCRGGHSFSWWSSTLRRACRGCSPPFARRSYWPARWWPAPCLTGRLASRAAASVGSEDAVFVLLALVVQGVLWIPGPVVAPPLRVPMGVRV